MWPLRFGELHPSQTLAFRSGVEFARMRRATRIRTLGHPQTRDLGCHTGCVNRLRVSTSSISPAAWTSRAVSDCGFHHPEAYVQLGWSRARD